MMWRFLAFLSGARVGDDITEAANGVVRMTRSYLAQGPKKEGTFYLVTTTF